MKSHFSGIFLVDSTKDLCSGQVQIHEYLGPSELTGEVREEWDEVASPAISGISAEAKQIWAEPKLPVSLMGYESHLFSYW